MVRARIVQAEACRLAPHGVARQALDRIEAEDSVAIERPERHAADPGSGPAVAVIRQDHNAGPVCVGRHGSPGI